MFRVYWRQQRAPTPVVTRDKECSPERHHADFPAKAQCPSRRASSAVRSSAFSLSKSLGAEVERFAFSCSLLNAPINGVRLTISDEIKILPTRRLLIGGRTWQSGRKAPRVDACVTTFERNCGIGTSASLPHCPPRAFLDGPHTHTPHCTQHGRLSRRRRVHGRACAPRRPRARLP